MSGASDAKSVEARADRIVLPCPSEPRWCGAMGGRFYPSLAAASATPVAGAGLVLQLGLVSLHSYSCVPSAVGPVMGAFLLLRGPDPSLAAFHLNLAAGGPYSPRLHPCRGSRPPPAPHRPWYYR